MIILGFFLISFVFAQSLSNCLEEGEGYAVVLDAPECCSGLTSIGCEKPDSEGNCQDCVGTFYCTYCGNGICGLGENKCNCPEDCVEEVTITCSSESIIGDANGDGDITLADASLVNDVYFGRKPKPSNICCLDANGDGDITPRDVQYIKSYYMKDGGETGNVGKKCVEVGTCTDSDGGKNYYDKGTVSRCNSADAAYKCETATDECAYCTGVCLEPPCEVTCGAVKEYYCEGSEIKSETYVCPTGYTCKDGACIKVVSSAPAPTPTSSECLPDGTLVKLPDDPKVYVIKDCKKKWIETIEEFQQGGYDWSDVQETSPEVVNAYTDYLEVVANLIKATNQSKVYKIINNKRFWIPTAEAFTQMGNDWLDIQDVDESGIEQYPRLRLAKLADDPKVYYLTEDGLKRHIPSVEVFNSYGNDWTDIAEIASIELNAYPDSILIRLTGDYKVYKLENNQKRWIKTAEVFNNLGYDWNKIAPVNDTEIEAYEEGDTID